MMKKDVSFDVSEWFGVKKKWLDFSPEHSISITILGNSMIPFLRKGDTVQIRSSSYQNIDIGTVIVYLHWDTNATIHRVVKVENQNGQTVYHTKGDNNPYPDNYTVKKEEVLGVVVECKRLKFWERIRWKLHG